MPNNDWEEVKESASGQEEEDSWKNLGDQKAQLTLKRGLTFEGKESERL